MAPHRVLPILIGSLFAAALFAFEPSAQTHADQVAKDKRPSGHKHAGERFRATSHRRFDDVEYWSGVFDDPERAAWQKPGEIVKAFDLRRGDTVADLGAGTGYFLPFLQAAVGERGTVYAVEVEPNLVAHIASRADKKDWDNVIPVLASLDNPRLPAGAIDTVVIIDTYHHLDDRRSYLDGLRTKLSARGRIAIIDWKKGDFPQGPDDSHKLSRDQIAGEMVEAGFRLVAEPPLLPYQYLLIFEPAVAAESAAPNKPKEP